MACDICGKTGTELEGLLDQYKTEDIQYICPQCVKEVNDHLWKLRKMTQNMNRTWLQRFMAALKEKSVRRSSTK